MLLLLFSLIAQGVLAYEEGYFTQFDQSVRESFVCKDGYQEFYEVNFITVHSIPPQIVLSMKQFEIEPAISPKESQFLFNYTDVTLTSFKFFIQCDQNQVFALRIKWFAFDDYRYEVLNFFNSDNFQSQVINHSNPNAQQGVVSVFSIGFKGPFSFNISVSNITSNNLTITFTDSLNLMENILTIGYQIVIYSPLIFGGTIRSQENWTSPATSNLLYTYQTTMTIGIEYLNTENLSLNYTQLSANPFQYKIESYNATYTANTHKSVYLYYYYTNEYLPLVCKNFRVYQRLSDQVPSTSFQIKILETDQEFNTIDQYTFLLDPSLAIVNFQITVNCLSTQNIKSSFFIRNSNTKINTFNDYLHYCTSQYHIFQYYLRFQSQNQIPAYQQIQVNINSSLLNITQINIINQLDITQLELAVFQLINK